MSDERTIEPGDWCPPIYRVRGLPVILDADLARALGMIQPVVEEASRELNVPSHVLLALSNDPELISMIEKRIADRPAESHSQDNPDAQTSDPIDYGAELAAAFGRPSEPHGPDDESADQRSSGLVNNPQFRRDRTREDIEEGIEREKPTRGKRMSRPSAVAARIFPTTAWFVMAWTGRIQAFLLPQRWTLQLPISHQRTYRSTRTAS